MNLQLIIRHFLTKGLLLAMLLSMAVPVFSQVPKDRQLADQYLNNSEYEKAASLYEKLMDTDPFGVYPQYLRCLISMKDYDVSEKLAKKVIRKMPDYSPYQVDLGYIYSLRGEADKSRQQYEKAIKSMKAEQGMVVALANSFLMRQETDYALRVYQEGKKIMKGIYSFTFETAEVYYQKGDFVLMTEEYLDAVEENPMMQQSVLNILQSRVGFDPDNTRNDILRTALLRRIQRNPDQGEYSEMLIWLFLQQKDFDSAFIQAKALDKRKNEDGSRIYNIGMMAESNLNYDAAIRCYQFVSDKGSGNPNYVSARIGLLNSLNRKITESNAYTSADLDKLDKDYRATLTELGRSPRTSPLIRGYAHLNAFYLDKIDTAITELEDAIDMPGISKNNQAECKLELADVYLFSGNVWDSDLLYKQVDKDFKNDPLGQEAKFRAARLDYYRGDFLWAQAQLDVLKSATSQLIANDALALSLLISDNIGLDSTTDALMLYSRADLLRYRNKDDEALKVLDTLLNGFPGHSLMDDAWYLQAKILDKMRDWMAADSLYRKIIDNDSASVIADDALFHRAELHESKLKDKQGAMDLYQQLLTRYPGSLFVVEARKRYRTLRGDLLN